MASANMPKSTRTALYRSRKRQQKRVASASRGFVTAQVNTAETFFGKTSRKSYRQLIDRRKRNG